jgi:hypothetical protein
MQPDVQHKTAGPFERFCKKLSAESKLSTCRPTVLIRNLSEETHRWVIIDDEDDGVSSHGRIP